MFMSVRVDMCVHLYVSMCTHVCVYVHVCEEITSDVIPQAEVTFKIGSLTGFKLTQQTRLGGQGAPGTFLCLCPQYWNYKHGPLCSAF